MTLPWYRRYPDNFIAGTVGLTLEEKGAYSLVLDLMYVRGGPVPDEPRYIAQVLRVSERSVTGWLKPVPTRADRIRANIAAMQNVTLFKW